MAYLYAYFDESGKYKEHPIVAFTGLVDGFQNWRDFGDKWAALLRRDGITNFHAVKALRCSEPLGNFGKCATPQERAVQLLPYVEEIRNGLELGISIAVDVTAYDGAKRLQQVYGDDPHYFAFYAALNIMLGHYQIPKPYTIGLICHDEQQKAIRCYKLLNRLKLKEPQIRQRITSICFSDDRDVPQLHAADLLAYLLRLEAQRIFAGREYPYESLFSAFFEGTRATGRKLEIAPSFFGAKALQIQDMAAIERLVFVPRK
ncbi:MAG: DUF3800 domain-containing protein [Candidatus Acidiferrales bacterium]